MLWMCGCGGCEVLGLVIGKSLVVVVTRMQVDEWMSVWIS